MPPPGLPTPPELVDLHVENLYILDAEGRMEAVRDGFGTQPPRFAIVRSTMVHRPLVGRAVPADTAAALLALAASEPVGEPLGEWPRTRAEYRRVLDAQTPVDREYCGPAFALPETDDPLPELARVLIEADRPLLERHFRGWARDFEPSQPIVAVIEDGAAVAVCGCARRRTAAVEAGVETVEAYRGRGYARAVTAVWAAALRSEGRLPLYSTSWDNVASQRVAGALGAVLYAVDFSLT